MTKGCFVKGSWMRPCDKPQVRVPCSAPGVLCRRGVWRQGHQRVTKPMSYVAALHLYRIKLGTKLIRSLHLLWLGQGHSLYKGPRVTGIWSLQQLSVHCFALLHRSTNQTSAACCLECPTQGGGGVHQSLMEATPCAALTRVLFVSRHKQCPLRRACASRQVVPQSPPPKDKKE